MSDIEVQLYPFQEAGVKFLSKLDVAFLTDEMGLGKSYQAIAWAVLKPGTKIVVCPASMKYVWQRFIETARSDDRVTVVGGDVLVPAPSRGGWVVINYDLLTRHLKALQALRAETLIVDESHYVKNKGAKRTRCLIELSKDIPRKLLVTGTPLLNRPMEMFTQLVILGKKNLKEWFRFGVRYCAGQQKFVSPRVGYVWDFSGASNLEELRTQIKPYFLRRLVKDVLNDLPPLVRADYRVDLDTLTARQYWLAEKDFRKWLEQQGKNPNKAMALTKLNALRQLAVRGKIAGLVERLDDFRQEGKKALIFCGFLVEGLDRLEQELNSGEYVRITGKENAEERMTAMDRFQNSPECLFALVSTMAGGMGITLTAATTVFFLDLPWSPKIKEQAEARAHRIGQQFPVQVIDLLGRGTIDEIMAAVLKNKAKVIDAVVEGTAEESEANLAWEVGQQIVRKGGRDGTKARS